LSARGARFASGRRLSLLASATRATPPHSKRITYNPIARAGLNPLDVVAKVRELLAKLAVVEGPDALSREAQRNATLLFFAHARAMLAAKRVLREHRLSAEALDYVIGEIEARFHKARAPAPARPSAGTRAVEKRGSFWC